jgi:hypothetical protein
MTTPYRTFWPEGVEHDPKYDVRVPPWRALEAQSIAVRQELIKLEALGQPVPRFGSDAIHRRRYGTVPNAVPTNKYDLHNIFCFQYLPSIYQAKEDAANLVKRILQRRGDREMEIQQYMAQCRNEMAHQMYHHAMWRRYGRRVYVLDDTTYKLLALTPLPALPCSLLAMPEHSFYLRLPKDAFNFNVWNSISKREDSQPIEGVMVAMDNITPDSSEPREMAFMAIGDGPDNTDRNLAYISFGLGPDALLSDIRIQPGNMKEALGGGNYAVGSEYELGVLVPRIIFGFLLYLQSEHPDIEPVDPAPRRHFKEIRSEQQRQAALQTQAGKLRNYTKLPILYIGRRHAEEVAEQVKELEFAQRSSSGDKTWTLDHQIWVRGHWKQQAYGENRQLRRMIWIRPYLRGPDMAESLKVAAMKVQKAQVVA